MLELIRGFWGRKKVKDQSACTKVPADRNSKFKNKLGQVNREQGLESQRSEILNGYKRYKPKIKNSG